MKPTKADAVFVKPGESSYIGIKRTYTNNVNSPYTECQDLTTYSSQLFDFMTNSTSFYSTYRQQDCFNLCIQQLIMETCNCSYSGFDIPPLSSNRSNITIRPCLTINEYTCYTNQFYKFDPVACASQSCPLECNTVEYDLSVSSLLISSVDEFWAYYGTDDYYNRYEVYSYENWRSKQLKLYVYYSKLEYTLIEETPSITFVGLLANIGGSMGLVVSLSAFTFFELIELIILMFYTYKHV